MHIYISYIFWSQHVIIDVATLLENNPNKATNKHTLSMITIYRGMTFRKLFHNSIKIINKQKVVKSARRAGESVNMNRTSAQRLIQ